MAILTLLLMVAPAPEKASVGLLSGAENFNLRSDSNSGPCGNRAGSDIVVCGHRKSDEIVVRDSARFADKPFKAEVALPGGAKLDTHGEQHMLADPRISPDLTSVPAAMVRIKIPF
jgi:hypothetical protein